MLGDVLLTAEVIKFVNASILHESELQLTHLLAPAVMNLNRHLPHTVVNELLWPPCSGTLLFFVLTLALALRV